MKSEILLSVCGDFLGIKVSAYKRYVTLKILSARFLEDTKILETCSGRFVLNRRIWKIIVRSRGKFLLYFSLLTCFPSNILLFRNNFFLTILLQNSNAFLTITYIFNNRLLCRQLLESCRLNFEQRIVILRIFS